METIRLRAPLDPVQWSKVKEGDKVLLSGTIYMARDAAHKRFIQALGRGEKLPFDIKGQVIYYAGPSPEREGEVIGSCGPTTSGRMDAYTPQLLDLGLSGMIGKGERSQEVKESIKKNKAIYFGATGGAAALLSSHIKAQKIIAYDDLGPEALRELELEDLPVIVLIK